jgi:DNA-binding MurR/RpiR family transcriptional regulator
MERNVPCTKYKEHSGNTVEINRASLPAADRLGEIVNPAAISTYFTCLREAERSAVYFYRISLLLFHEAQRSLFQSYFYLVHCTWYFVQ